jgi:hypothetical protein
MTLGSCPPTSSDSTRWEPQSSAAPRTSITIYSFAAGRSSAICFSMFCSCVFTSDADAGDSYFRPNFNLRKIEVCHSMVCCLGKSSSSSSKAGGGEEEAVVGKVKEFRLDPNQGYNTWLYWLLQGLPAAMVKNWYQSAGRRHKNQGRGLSLWHYQYQQGKDCV